MQDNLNGIIDKLGEVAAENALNIIARKSNDTIQMSPAHENDTYEIEMQERKSSYQQLNTIKIMTQILEKISIRDVRDCLDEMRFNSKFFREDDVVVTSLSADEHFNHKVLLLFRIEGKDNDWLLMRATAEDMYIPSNEELLAAYINANKYNDTCRYGKAYVERDSKNGTFYYVFEENLVADKPTSYESLKENILLYLNSAWQFFCDYSSTTKSDEC